MSPPSTSPCPCPSCSHSRLRSLKQELSVTSASARAERHEALARLRELETEVARLVSAVGGHACLVGRGRAWTFGATLGCVGNGGCGS